MILKNCKRDFEQKGISMLLYAPPKTGKTSFLATLPGKVLLVYFEGGWAPLNQCENIDILEVEKNMEGWINVWTYMISVAKDYDFIAMDSMSDMVNHMSYYFAANSKNKGKMEQGQYLEMYIKLATIGREFRDLTRLGTNTVLLCTEQKIKVEQNDMSVKTETHPLLPEKKLAEMEGLYDVIAHMEIAEATADAESFRWLRLDKSDNIMAGNRINNNKTCRASWNDFITPQQ